MPLLIFALLCCLRLNHGRRIDGHKEAVPSGGQASSKEREEIHRLENQNKDMKMELERLQGLLDEAGFLTPDQALKVKAKDSPSFQRYGIASLLVLLALAGLAFATRSIDADSLNELARLLETSMSRANASMLGRGVPEKKATAVYALISVNLAIFIADKCLRLPLSWLYLWHRGWAWWQPFTACFCHGSRAHLSGNMFLLLLFGRSVEDDLGWAGLLFTFAFCGMTSNFVSLLILPSSVVSLGASGAVFGLFAVSILGKLSWKDLDWRKVAEVAVLGEFVFGKIVSEIQIAATGHEEGVDHVGHLVGVAAGIGLVVLLRSRIAKSSGAANFVLCDK